MKTRILFPLVMALATVSYLAPSANAQCGGYGYGGYGGWGGWGAFDVGRLYGVLANNVPYYAAFPPVYYSAPVPRTYGYSPFAYPPGVMTPEIVQSSEPVEIINPHFKASTATASDEEVEDKITATPTTDGPLVVLNPYVTTRVADAQR